MARGYGKSQSASIEAHARSAERRGRCLRPEDPAEGALLRQRVRGGTFVSPRRGLFARTRYWESLTPADRVLHVMRSVSDSTGSWGFRQAPAAIAHGLEVPLLDADVLNVRASRTRPSGTGGVLVRQDPSHPLEFVMANEARVTTIARTLLDCLSELDFPRALSIADSYLRSRQVQLDDLRSELLALHVRGRGEREALDRALGVAKWANPLSENGGESYARATMLSLGFAAPQLQATFPDPLRPGHVFRVDFCWAAADGGLILGELDGLEKYYEPEMTGGRPVAEVMSRERIRESKLNLLGAKVVRFTFSDVLHTEGFRTLLTCAGVPRR